jgi:DNA-binding transcriptional LysR family regulator
VDIALLIQTGWQRSSADGLDRVELLADPMYVCLPQSHPKVAKGRLELDDLQHDPRLVGSSAAARAMRSS